ncbi:MAG: PPE family protein [Mycobacteriaceae bacterium]|nr:PPE family protein [Mycobacteriaceae bacterium]
MDFGALPPEVNSMRMYSGPGSAPLMAAASAWNGLAAELHSAAAGYERIIIELTGEEWLGSASQSAAEAVAPYVSWMLATAAQAEQTASQLRATAAAYEAAFAAMVPPPLIATNRMQLATLVPRNVFGQYTEAIAALEAQYGQMWAQDAEAMYSYAATSASSSVVTPFSPPPQMVSSAAAASAAGSAQSTLMQLVTSLPNALQGLAAPAAAASANPLAQLWQILFGQSTLPTSLSGLLSALQPYASFFYNTEGLPYFSVGMSNNFIQEAKTLGLFPGAAGSPVSGGIGGLAKGLGATGLSSGGQPVAASFGNAPLVGRLSVPSSWVPPASSISPSISPIPISSIGAEAEAGAGGNLLGGMPLAGAGHGVGGSAPKYGVRPTVMPRTPFVG